MNNASNNDSQTGKGGYQALLEELRSLASRWPEDARIQELLAKELFDAVNAANDVEGDIARAGLQVSGPGRKPALLQRAMAEAIEVDAPAAGSPDRSAIEEHLAGLKAGMSEIRAALRLLEQPLDHFGERIGRLENTMAAVRSDIAALGKGIRNPPSFSEAIDARGHAKQQTAPWEREPDVAARRSPPNRYEFVPGGAAKSFSVTTIGWVAVLVAARLSSHAWQWPFAVILGLALLPLALSGGVRRRA